MKKMFILLLSVVLVKFSEAQILKKIGERAKQKVEQRADQKVDRSIDEGLDEVEGKGKPKTGDDGTDNNVIQAKNTASPQTLQAYSKYDFVQGDKVVAYEDFSRVNIGDFPTNWNTDASAEVVTLNNKEGKWLKIDTRGHYHAEFINNIPENSTLEFDLGVNNNYEWGSSNLYMSITRLDNRSNISHSGSNPKIHFTFHPITGENYSGGLGYRTEYSANTLSNNGLTIKNWDNKTNTFAHVSIWRQGQRLRMYVNGQKVIDVPKAFDVNGKYTDLIFETSDISKEKGDYYVLGNFRLATGAPDTRNKLMTEGKFVTTGITFDVASDKIKPTSYGIMKEIATALAENPGVKIKIVGHTDSDGDDAANLDLSKRRAAAVRAALASEFNIDASRMETDGLGETKPIADNTKLEGKAQNRRVEFVKQ